MKRPGCDLLARSRLSDEQDVRFGLRDRPQVPPQCDDRLAPSDQPRFDFLRPRVVVLPGDRVLTSGHGGVLPAGLPIGEVVSAGETGVKVEPYVDTHRLEFLRILDYEMPGLLTPVQGGQ